MGDAATSTAVTFSYNTTVTVERDHPTTGTTYGANWSGSITGTARRR